MTRKLWLIPAAIATLMLAPAGAALASSPCAERGEIVKKLSDEYKENPQAVGIINPNAMVEIFISDKGTWTIIATGTDGKSCVISAGEGWESTQLAYLPGA
ncbi:MAG: hypothetical protein H0T56_08460 [Pseudaminobacter sp.]|nr:hypothetical protein [Pseudaminobacter sp.]